MNAKNDWKNTVLAVLAAALAGQTFAFYRLPLAQAQRESPQPAATHKSHLSAAHTPHASEKMSPFHQALNESMTVMHQKMGEVEFSDDFDRDFLAAMIPHHEGAIEMSKLILLHGKNESVRRLAQEIIIEQQAEIRAMKTLLPEDSSAIEKGGEINHGNH